MEVIEKPAIGVKGCLLYSPHDHRHFFRVYDEHDKSKYVDYSLASEDISVIIDCKLLSLYATEDGEGNKLDWSSKYLGR